jgi:hypothetical protein
MSCFNCSHDPLPVCSFGDVSGLGCEDVECDPAFTTMRVACAISEVHTVSKRGFNVHRHGGQNLERMTLGDNEVEYVSNLYLIAADSLSFRPCPTRHT